jgi:hypothetical protein
MMDLDYLLSGSQPNPTLDGPSLSNRKSTA